MTSRFKSWSGRAAARAWRDRRLGSTAVASGDAVKVRSGAWSTGLSPLKNPEVLPLLAAIAAGGLLVVTIVTHDLRTNPEVLIKKKGRAIQIVEEGTPEYDKQVEFAKKSYDHWLRRRLVGLRPWIFPRLQERIMGVSRKDPTIDLTQDKWKKIAEKEHKKK